MYDLIVKISDIYNIIDQKVSTFQAVCAVTCLPGCGACCRSENVEAAVIEMLPAAAEIVRLGQADFWRQRLENVHYAGPCVFYDEVPMAFNSHCRFYPWRARVCRLFGFAAMKDKYGAVTPIICREMKSRQPDALAKMTAAISSGFSMPLFTDYSTHIPALAPGPESRLTPINQAIGLAIEKVGLALDLAGRQAYPRPHFNIAA